MGLLVLFLITLLFLGINYTLTKGDFLAPSTLFCEMFFLYELVCVIGQSYYAITIHLETIAVITCGLTVFTCFQMLSSGKGFSTYRFSDPIDLKPKYINIPQKYINLLIVLQIATIFFFIRYLQAIAGAYGSGGSSLSEMISLYDTMTKFWTTTFRNLNVSIPMFYRIFNPITSAAAYIILYVAVNNFMVCRKVKLSYIVVVGLLCILILLNGSRSPLLRIFTMVVILNYVFYYRIRLRKNKGLKSFMKLAGLMIIVAAAMFLTLIFMGRVEKFTGLLSNLFVYLGAPIVNLDTFFVNSGVSFVGGFSSLFGEHTFGTLYSYIGKLFGIEAFTSIKGINSFTYSSNGIEIGNVYTTFYPFVYDFGFIGVLPLISIVAAYYAFSYKKVLKKRGRGVIDFRLFIYSYLFNDLMMLTFSNRFFETVLDAPFIKHFLFSWLLIQIVFEHSLNFGKYRFKFGGSMTSLKSPK